MEYGCGMEVRMDYVWNLYGLSVDAGMEYVWNKYGISWKIFSVGNIF